MTKKKRKTSKNRLRESSSTTKYRSYGCRNCGYKTYEDEDVIFCGFCMNKILIELGYMKDPMLEDKEANAKTDS